MKQAVKLDRRSLLAYTGLAPLIGAMPLAARAAEETAAEKADYTLRIATGLVDCRRSISSRPRSTTVSSPDR